MAGTPPPEARPKKKEYSSRRTITVAVVCIVILAGTVLSIWYLSYRPCCTEGSPPLVIQFSKGGVPSSTACGTTAGALYQEAVPVTSTTGTITTNTLGLKMIPTAGGSAVTNVAPPSSGSPCPATGGFYVALNNSAGTIVACWTGVVVSGDPVWSSPTSGACANPNGAPLGSPITISAGDTLGAYMYGSTYPGVPPMAGAFSLQPYGTNGAYFSTGGVDL